MEIKDVKVGQTVEILEGNLFYGWNIGEIGTVKEIDGEYVTVLFKDGDDDYGYAAGLRLVKDLAVPAENLKAAIADVEKALEALKALVG